MDMCLIGQMVESEYLLDEFESLVEVVLMDDGGTLRESG